MNRRAAGFCVAALLATVGPAIAGANVLPVYIEDNHAGTFYWLAQHIDVDQACTLLLFDAHSDASGIFDSDKIRYALRNVASLEDRRTLLERWRNHGTVQCFNWIEPLMPAPIAKVIWVPAEKLSPAEIRKRTQKASALLDGHLEAAPRKSGSFFGSYAVTDLQNVERNIDTSRPLIVTIDLDYFAGLPAPQQETAFAWIWNFVIQRPNLRAITLAISRPYLKTDEEAHRLLKLALTSALSLPTAQIEFEPFLTVPNDHSNLAKELMVKGEKLPAFDLAAAPQELRARILSESKRITVLHDVPRWQQLLRLWNDEAPQLHLQVKDRQPSTDNVWRIPTNELAEIELLAEPWTTKPEKIEWFGLTPKYSRCNLTDLTIDQVGFVANAAPRPAWNEIAIEHHHSVLPISKIDNLFDRQLHCGSLRLRARALVGGKIRETPMLELRRFVGSGFRAAISEQFGLPYLFGSGELSNGSDTGPETNLGADCANFVAYALRRQGQCVPWSDPKQLREHLELVTRSVAPGSTAITAKDLQEGLIVHLDTHVAAVMEDREPVGVLDENDLVAHQLGATPEIVSLGQLMRQRMKNRFDLLRVRQVDSSMTLVFGGDVMLGRTCATKIENGMDPFAGIASILRGASFAAANLECTISSMGEATPRTRYAFRAPARSAQLLRRAGFHAMGLANNHALDFGNIALQDSAARLSRENVEAVGVATSSGNAYTPHLFSLPDGRKLALVAINDVDTAEGSQVAAASDRIRLKDAIGNARSRANLVVCLVHWGIEHSEDVTDEQRELARWLVDHDVDVVAGSHPHRVQPLDFYHGRAIAYSLGNLVFDGAPSLESWNRGALLEVGVDANGNVASAGLIPLVLEDGLPHVRVNAEQAVVEA
jgi:hypothetical protein